MADTEDRRKYAYILAASIKDASIKYASIKYAFTSASFMHRDQCRWREAIIGCKFDEVACLAVRMASLPGNATDTPRVNRFAIPPPGFSEARRRLLVLIPGLVDPDINEKGGSHEEKCKFDH